MEKARSFQFTNQKSGELQDQDAFGRKPFSQQPRSSRMTLIDLLKLISITGCYLAFFSIKVLCRKSNGSHVKVGEQLYTFQGLLDQRESKMSFGI